MLLGLYAVLQAGWSMARDTQVERVVIHDLTVGTAVVLINGLTPAVQAQGIGSRIGAEGGGINIRNGCEGTEIWFLLVAAMLVVDASWRGKFIGVLAGAAFVFVLNQARVLGLFYSLRHGPGLFDALHTFIAPLAMVAGSLLLFVAWFACCGARRPSSMTA